MIRLVRLQSHIQKPHLPLKNWHNGNMHTNKVINIESYVSCDRSPLDMFSLELLNRVSSNTLHITKAIRELPRGRYMK